MKKRNKVIYKSNFSDFNEFVANILFYKITSLLKTTTNQLNIALSGGSTPLPVLKLLRDKKLEWERIKFFMVDERCVPLDHHDSNYGNINKVFFNHIPSLSFPIVKENISYIDCAKNYEEIIISNVSKTNNIPQFDLITLGMGLDGHIASLFPNTKALNENKALVMLNNIPQLNTKRITITIPLIINAKSIILVTKGIQKSVLLDNIYKKDLPIAKIMCYIDTIIKDY